MLSLSPPPPGIQLQHSSHQTHELFSPPACPQPDNMHIISSVRNNPSMFSNPPVTRERQLEGRGPGDPDTQRALRAKAEKQQQLEPCTCLASSSTNAKLVTDCNMRFRSGRSRADTESLRRRNDERSENSKKSVKRECVKRGRVYSTTATI